MIMSWYFAPCPTEWIYNLYFIWSRGDILHPVPQSEFTSYTLYDYELIFCTLCHRENLQVILYMVMSWYFAPCATEWIYKLYFIWSWADILHPMPQSECKKMGTNLHSRCMKYSRSQKFSLVQTMTEELLRKTEEWPINLCYKQGLDAFKEFLCHSEGEKNLLLWTEVEKLKHLDTLGRKRYVSGCWEFLSLPWWKGSSNSSKYNSFW